jgi:hypothetical protein
VTPEFADTMLVFPIGTRVRRTDEELHFTGVGIVVGYRNGGCTVDVEYPALASTKFGEPASMLEVV